MKLEKFISQISAVFAAIIMFLFASGMYLSFKGFVFNEDGSIVLTSAANAQEPTNEPTKVALNLALPSGHSMGSTNAPVTIYEFSSLTCFHCAIFHNSTLPKIKKEFIDTGKLRVVFIDFPIEPKAMQASLIAHCVDDSKYFDFLSLLFKKQKDWGLSNDPQKYLLQYAALNGVDEAKAKACLKNSKTAQEILDNRQHAIDYFKINGTPSLLIVKGNERLLYQGALSYEKLQEILSKN